MPGLRVSEDRQGFVTTTGERFIPWGANYDHDAAGTLLEDYWADDWQRVAGDFAEMRQLGFNTIRVHLQFGRFMKSPTEADTAAVDLLKKLVELAEHEQLYLDLTGLGCYHKQAVPAWYDALDETARWSAQAEFWKAIARTVHSSPAIFCYDLMNEPVVPGGRRAAGDWLGPAFGDKHFVQVITLDQADRPRPAIARAWIDQLVAAIRTVDTQHLITVGMVDWSLDRPGLTSGFVPQEVAERLDFIAVHLYPKSGKVAEAIETLRGFNIGKPIVIEETFPLGCSMEEMATFLKDARPHAAGVISFYWGTPPAELTRSEQLVDQIVGQWLQRFPALRWQP